MNGFEHFIQHHGAIDIVACYLLSAILSGMPALPPTATWGQQWAYHVCQILRANLAQYLSAPPKP